MKDLTQGSVTRQLMGLTGFMMIGMVVQILYNLIDLYWVGRLGPSAQAAVGLCNTLMMLVMSLSQMLGSGTGALVAQAVGRKDHEEAHHVFNQSIGIGLTVMVVFGVVGIALEGVYARALAADAETAGNAVAYLHWFIPAMALQFPMMGMGAALRGTGNMKPGTWAQVGSVLLNILLAPLLIFGWLGLPRLGVAGAGLATFIAVLATTTGLSLYFLRPQTFLRVRPREWPAKASTWWRIIRIGLPSAVEFALMGAYMVFVTVMLRPFGAIEQDAFTVSQRLMQTAMMPMMAMSFAVSAVAGQNYGARLGRRVREVFVASLKIGMPAMTLFFLVGQLLAPQLIQIFTKDPAVVAGGVEFLRVITYNLFAMAVAFACFGVLSGLGNTLPTLISSATRIFLTVAITLAISGSAGFKPIWIWYISLAATVVQMLMNVWFLRRELQRKLGSGELIPA